LNDGFFCAHPSPKALAILWIGKSASRAIAACRTSGCTSFRVAQQRAPQYSEALRARALKSAAREGKSPCKDDDADQLELEVGGKSLVVRWSVQGQPPTRVLTISAVRNVVAGTESLTTEDRRTDC
jgi:hypothetical protein